MAPGGPAAPSPAASDPVALLRLLWGLDDTSPRRGPRRTRSIDDIVGVGIRLADQGGMEAVTMRAVAQLLDLSTMSLYGYVPDKAALVALMIDRSYQSMARPPLNGGSIEASLTQVADANRQLVLAHPWLAETSSARPPLGPGVMAKYEYELSAFAGLGLDDVTTDDCLGYLLTFVHAAARQQLLGADQRDATGMDDQEWWEQHQPVFARIFDPEQYPLASRIGTAAATTNGSAYEPDHAYRFGLARTIAAITDLSEAE